MPQTSRAAEIATFTSPCRWPEQGAPSQLYYDHEDCRIFMIENTPHDWDWLRNHGDRFRDTDVFLVGSGRYYDDLTARETSDTFDTLPLPKKQFVFLFNTVNEIHTSGSYDIHGVYMNKNMWLNENVIKAEGGRNKDYDAVYVTRRSPDQRHYLAAKIGNLALVLEKGSTQSFTSLPRHTYMNVAALSMPDRLAVICRACCGLSLADIKGTNFSIGEYLLCGLPVVSSHAPDGRSEWLNEYNAIECAPTVDSVLAAVEQMKQSPRDPNLIREMHIAQANQQRLAFVDLLRTIFKKAGIHSENAEAVFKQRFADRIINGVKPERDKYLPKL